MANNSEVCVVMVPFLAQGHLGQLLDLSRLIASYNIPVHYVSSSTHIHQARIRHQSWDLDSVKNIHIHDFPIQPFHSPPPDPKANTKYPNHLTPAFEGSVHLRELVCQLLTSLSKTVRRLIIILDNLMAYVVQDFESLPNAEAYSFQNSSAFFYFSYYWDLAGRPIEPDNKILQELPGVEGCFSSDLLAFVGKQQEYLKNISGHLYNTSKSIEGHYFNLLNELKLCERQWALGPFIPVEISKKTDQQHKCLDWLDSQALNSVIYVSFGTTTSLSEEEVHPLAVGIENSCQKFLWVLRDADTVDLFTGQVRKPQLPEGFEDRILKADQGMIVRDWAPQLEILAHTSTGGFMSHCGWNSCLESITMGVPMAAWPMHSDQPRNAVLMTKILQIGTIVKEWEEGNALLESSIITNAIKKVMASREGDEMRKRSAELSDTIRKSVAEGGARRIELDSFVSHITR